VDSSAFCRYIHHTPAATVAANETPDWELVNMTNATDYTIAETIRQQIGNRAFMMLGVKTIVCHRDRLVIHLGSGARYGGQKVNRCTVILDANDTYTVEVSCVRGLKSTTWGSMCGVYVDSLHRVIERLTGMYLSL